MSITGFEVSEAIAIIVKCFSFWRFRLNGLLWSFFLYLIILWLLFNGALYVNLVMESRIDFHSFRVFGLLNAKNLDLHRRHTVINVEIDVVSQLRVLLILLLVSSFLDGFFASAEKIDTPSFDNSKELKYALDSRE